MAWVPTTIETSPLAMASCCCWRALPFCLPANQPTLIPRGSNHCLKVFACCSARISVGAIKATCLPFSMAHSAANAATSVLPEPTSPWIKRIIGAFFRKSVSISATTRFCALVGENGKFASKGVLNFPDETSGSAYSRSFPARMASILKW